MTFKQFEYDGKGYLRAVPTAGEVLGVADAAQVADTVAPEFTPVDPVRSAVEPTGLWARVRAALAKWLSESPEDRLRVDYERWIAERAGHERRARRLQQSLMLAGSGLR